MGSSTNVFEAPVSGEHAATNRRIDQIAALRRACDRRQPFAVAILTSAFQSLDKSLEEAALDLGESRAATFRLIILPLVMPGIIASFVHRSG